MNKKAIITASIILSIYLLLLIAIFANKNMYNAVVAGSIGICAGVFIAVAGFIISLFKQAKQLGLGIIIGGSLIAIIGIGLCSTT